MKKFISFCIVALLFSPLLAEINLVYAASLTNIVVTPASQNQSTSTNVTVTFTPNTAISNGSKLVLTYDSTYSGGGTLTDSDISITATNLTSKVCSGFINGYFTCTLTTSANVTTGVTIVIGGTNKLTTPAAAGNYPFSITVDIGGTGTTFDSGAGLSYISNNSVKENEVQVNAYVPPTVALDLFVAGTNTKLTDANTCNLGILSLTSVNTCTYDIGAGTNNSTGVTIKVTSDGKLRQGLTNFTDTSGTITAGTEAYGFYISAPGSVFTASGSYGTSYQAVPQTTPVFATSSTVSNELSTAQHITVQHAAAMSTATQVGSYTHKMIYTAFTN